MGFVLLFHCQGRNGILPFDCAWRSLATMKKVCLFLFSLFVCSCSLLNATQCLVPNPYSLLGWAREDIAIFGTYMVGEVS